MLKIENFEIIDKNFYSSFLEKVDFNSHVGGCVISTKGHKIDLKENCIAEVTGYIILNFILTSIEVKIFEKKFLDLKNFCSPISNFSRVT